MTSTTPPRLTDDELADGLRLLRQVVLGTAPAMFDAEGMARLVEEVIETRAENKALRAVETAAREWVWEQTPIGHRAKTNRNALAAALKALDGVNP